MARTYVVKVRLNAEELAWLDEMVAERGTSRSEAIRHNMRAVKSHARVLRELDERGRKLVER